MEPTAKSESDIVASGNSGAKIQKTTVTITYTNPDGSSLTATIDNHIVMAASGDYLPESSGSLEKAEAALDEHEENVERSMAESLARLRASEATPAERKGHRPKR